MNNIHIQFQISEVELEDNKNSPWNLWLYPALQTSRNTPYFKRLEPRANTTHYAGLTKIASDASFDRHAADGRALQSCRAPSVWPSQMWESTRTRQHPELGGAWVLSPPIWKIRFVKMKRFFPNFWVEVFWQKRLKGPPRESCDKKNKDFVILLKVKTCTSKNVQSRIFCRKC